MTGKQPNKKSAKFRAAFKVLSEAVWVAWPLLLCLSFKTDWVRPLLAVSIVLLIFKLFEASKHPSDVRIARSAGAAVGILCLAAALITGKTTLSLWYPVIVNASLFAVFGLSLLSQRTVIERFAVLQRKGVPLPEEGVRYTRGLTKLWMLFFAANGAAATATCVYGNLNIWTLYNGVVSYVLIGLFLGGEYLYRTKVRNVG
jgi:uncharacterized membrane protein